MEERRERKNKLAGENQPIRGLHCDLRDQSEAGNWLPAPSSNWMMTGRAGEWRLVTHPTLHLKPDQTIQTSDTEKNKGA